MKKEENPSKETLDQWSKDPNNWIWGMFYYNPKDKRIFPPKRHPWMGWTVNFANRNSLFFFIGMLLFFLLVTYTIQSKH
jgi:uncharacterized membrane protein